MIRSAFPSRRRTSGRRLAALAGLAILAVSTGCGDGPLGVAAVRVTPATATLGALGETVQLTASALDRRGNPIPGLFFSWASSDELVATVDDTGLVTAVGNGVATVTARAGGESGSAQVTVNQQGAGPGAGAPTVMDDSVSVMG